MFKAVGEKFLGKRKELLHWEGKCPKCKCGAYTSDTKNLEG